MRSKYSWLLKVRPAVLASFLKKVLMIKRYFVETAYGSFYIDPVSNFGNAITTDKAYEQDLTDSVTGILAEGDTFLDVGANEGFFSIVASKSVGHTGQVVSVEPQSRLQNVLVKNIVQNAAYNISIFQRAISDSQGIATISLAPDTNTGSSGLFRATRYANPTEEVLQITLSTFIKSLNMRRIKLMKIDIESFEYEAVMGSQDIFKTNLIENIALELHPSLLTARGKSADDIVLFLQSVGYTENKSYKSYILTKTV